MREHEWMHWEFSLLWCRMFITAPGQGSLSAGTSHFPLKEEEEMATGYGHLPVSKAPCASPAGFCIARGFVPISFVSFGTIITNRLVSGRQDTFRGEKSTSLENDPDQEPDADCQSGKQRCLSPKYVGSLEGCSSVHRLGTFMQALRLLLPPPLLCVPHFTGHRLQNLGRVDSHTSAVGTTTFYERLRVIL